MVKRFKNNKILLYENERGILGFMLLNNNNLNKSILNSFLDGGAVHEIKQSSF